VITAILSSFNELHNSIFWRNLEELKGRTQLIIVDGGSQDGTLEHLRVCGADVYLMPGSNRAARYNRGIEQARGDLILLVHPRTLVPPRALDAIQLNSGSTVWGALTHAFDRRHPLLAFTSWYSNRVRGDGRGIYYLDHCLFFSKDLREHAVFPDVELFEDTYFCARLRRRLKPVRLPVVVQTSAVRFTKNGMFRQSLMNQIMKLLFYLRVSERWMNRIYECGLGLNRRV
jgi:glycosyltransferase involved in cell wall biosynthesis